jgi:hypothetical protein
MFVLSSKLSPQVKAIGRFTTITLRFMSKDTTLNRDGMKRITRIRWVKLTIIQRMELSDSDGSEADDETYGDRVISRVQDFQLIILATNNDSKFSAKKYNKLKQDGLLFQRLSQNP